MHAVIVTEDPVIYLCIPAGGAIIRSASASQPVKKVTDYVPSEMLDERLPCLPHKLVVVVFKQIEQQSERLVDSEQNVQHK